MNSSQLDQLKADPVKFMNGGKYIWNSRGAAAPKTGYNPIGGSSKVKGVKEFPIQKVKNVSDYYLSIGGKQIEAAPSQGAPGQKVKAFFLPWLDGKGLYTLTEEDATADFLFTPRLNACAVIVGGDARRPVIAHCNAPDPPIVKPSEEVTQKQADEQTREKQLEYYQAFYYDVMKSFKEKNLIKQDPVIVSFAPNIYVAKGDGIAYVFGVKKDGAWKFYYTMLVKGVALTNELFPRLTEPK